MTLKNLTIGALFRLSLGLLLVLLSGLGAVAVWQTERLWRQTEHLHDRSLEVGHAIGRLEADVLTARAELRGYLLAENDEERNAAVQASETALADSERQFAVLYERYTGPRADLDRARETFTRWRALHVGNRDLSRAGRKAEAEARLRPSGDIGVLRLQLVSQIGTIRAFWKERADSAFAQARQEKTAMRRLAFAVAAAAVLLAGATFWVLRQSVRAPLEQIVGVIERFRRGERAARTGYASRSEIGVLAGAFDELAETVETQARIDAQAAHITAHKEAEALLEESRRCYEGLFENAPIPLWLEDFSAVRERLAELGLLGQDERAVGDFFARDDAAFHDCIARVRVLQVNRACLDLHAARSKAELLEGLARFTTEPSRAALLLQLAAVAGGQTRVEIESKVLTLDGRARDVHLRSVVMPGYERTYGRVLVTTEDITGLGPAHHLTDRTL